MKITAEQYGVLCDVVERARHRWPVQRGDDEAPVLHTSDYAREAAMRIVDELGLELEPPDRDHPSHPDHPDHPEFLRSAADYLEGSGSVTG